MATLQYTDSKATLKASLIAKWRRADIPAAVMSASSGPKDYFKNKVFALFEQQPEAERAALFMSASGTTMLLLWGAGSKWFDVTGREVKVTA